MELLDLKMDNDKIFAIGVKVLIILAVAAVVGIVGNSFLSGQKSGGANDGSIVSSGDEDAPACPLYSDCLGDTNGDLVVNQEDFDSLTENWLRRDCEAENQCCNGADLTGDGWVNFQDLSVYSDNSENICK